MTGHEVAQDWLARNEKHPIQTVPRMLWRWTLEDQPATPTIDELPAEVFGHLPQDPDTDHPWLFTTREKAEFAAVLAVYAAMRAGWTPKEKEATR